MRADQDFAHALSWYSKAAAQGHASAQFRLGIMYDTGKGIQQDYGQAVVWYQMAAEQGYAQAQYNLGVLTSSPTPKYGWPL